VTAIELVNEPMGPALDMDGVRQFYYDGWGVLQDQQQGTVAVIHDAFQPLASWNGFMTTGFSHVLLDTHQYQIFTSDQVAMSLQAHIAAACALGPQLASTDLWTVVGEMTGAMTDCTQWLNGRGIGARYDGTYPGSTVVGTCTGKYKGNASAFSDADKVALRRFVEAQLDAYERHTGWIWWTWKAESAPEWNLQALLAAGLFPQPLSQRLYPNQCEY
jgi:glucan 1,3-beta-glucosidase